MTDSRVMKCCPSCAISPHVKKGITADASGSTVTTAEEKQLIDPMNKTIYSTLLVYKQHQLDAAQ